MNDKVIILRQPEPKDLEDMAMLEFYIWNVLYRDFLPPAFLEKHYTMQQCLDLQNRLLQLRKAQPSRHFLLAAFDGETGELAGICHIDTNETRNDGFDVDGFDTELCRLYLWPQYRARGLGGKLFGAGREWLENHGYASIFAWSFDLNSYGRFYRKHLGRTVRTVRRDYEGASLDLTAYGWTQ